MIVNLGWKVLCARQSWSGYRLGRSDSKKGGEINMEKPAKKDREGEPKQRLPYSSPRMIEYGEILALTQGDY